MTGRLRRFIEWWKGFWIDVSELNEWILLQDVADQQTNLGLHRPILHTQHRQNLGTPPDQSYIHHSATLSAGLANCQPKHVMPSHTAQSRAMTVGFLGANESQTACSDGLLDLDSHARHT